MPLGLTPPGSTWPNLILFDQNRSATLTYFWNLPLFYSTKRRIGARSVSPGGRRRICGIPHPPPAAPAAGGWGIPRSALRRVDKGFCGGAAVEGWPASLFCGSAASPPWRRPRRRSLVAGASLFCCRSFRRRWQAGDEWAGGRRRRCEAAAAGWCGVLVVDLATSGEVVRRRPRSRAEDAWGVPPADGRHPSSDPARRSWWLLRLINAFGQGAPLLHGCELWAVAFSLVSGDGGRPCWSSSRLKTASCSSDDLCILLFLFFACIRLCNPPFYI